uniref:NADH-ubiquinone oxidoreductase chain 6 n=1 Tax=Ephemerella sp. Yunnan-2018 TaxID=2748056 RepID=A0A7D6FUL7_9INSE|nr:NADH dehydrogenase subunit 6 [Ephemerella sp. Yunnan-2018]QLP88966.1 NADH dehydrogenase subunit 6 [Ephemerella sp. Yunnan-2018]
MTTSLLLLSTTVVSSLFLFMTHPLAMGLILLIQTCLVALFTGSLTSLFWFGYILFLVFLGGMLVLFIYMTSLASNEMFSLSSPLVMSLLPLFIGSSIIMGAGVQLFDWAYPSGLSNETFEPILSNNPLPILILKLFSSLSAHLTILLACYLFLTLIAVVHITSFNQGPLRTHLI